MSYVLKVFKKQSNNFVNKKIFCCALIFTLIFFSFKTLKYLKTLHYNIN